MKHNKIKIAFAITGAGHKLRESIEVLEELIKNGDEIHIFLSAAAVVVLKMYKLYEIVENILNSEGHKLKVITEEKQFPAYPISAHFNLQRYDILIISPITSNTVAKMTNGIADSLISNIFAQMIKGGGEIYCVPSDLIGGDIDTDIPSGDKVTIHIAPKYSVQARSLEEFPKVTVFESPKKILKILKKTE